MSEEPLVIRKTSTNENERQLVEIVGRNYRLWARLPAGVRALRLVGDPKQKTTLAVVARPRFPKGVCTGCGCSTLDPCVEQGLMGPVGCYWIDRSRTRCSVCGPAPKQVRR